MNKRYDICSMDVGMNYNEVDPMAINAKNAMKVFDKLESEELLEILNGSYSIMNRSLFCSFLGIRESTLSGWLKDKKLPQYAKISFGLLVMLEKLKKRTKSLQEEMLVPIPINLGDQWGLVECSQVNDEEMKANLIASGISTEEEAVRLQGLIKGGCYMLICYQSSSTLSNLVTIPTM